MTGVWNTTFQNAFAVDVEDQVQTPVWTATLLGSPDQRASLARILARWSINPR